MKRRTFILPILAIIVAVILTTTYAWYISMVKNETDKVDFTSNGILLSYTVDDSTDVNVKTIEVKPVTFVDLNNAGEGYYFTSFALQYKFTITNKSTDPVDITIKQDEIYTYTLTTDTKFKSGKEYYTRSGSVYSLTTVTVGNDVTLSTYYEKNPYLAMVVTNVDLKLAANTSMIEANNDISVKEYLSTNRYTNTFVINDVSEVDDTETNDVIENQTIVYVYIFGVQPNDDSNNTFLGTDKKYNISLKILAEVAE